MVSKFQEIYKMKIWKLVQAVIVSMTVCITFNLTTSNVLYLLVGGLYLICEKHSVELEKKEKWISILTSILFSTFMVGGNIEAILAVEFLLAWPVTVLVCVCGFYLCFSILISHLLVYLRNVEVVETVDGNTKRRVVIIFLISFISLMLVWGVGWLISYPANTTRDSNGIINTALGNMDMNAAVPVVYVLAVRFLWNVGYSLFGTGNASLALCSLVQVIMVAGIVSYLMCRLYSYHVKKWICVVVWAFYAFVPYNVQLPHTIWKDIPFSASVFLFSILVWELYLEKYQQNKVVHYIKLLFLIMAAIGVCLLRNNGLFAYIFFLPFGILVFWKKRKSVVLSLIVAFGLVRIIQGPVYDRIMTENYALVHKEEIAQAQEGTNTGHAVQITNATDSYNSSGFYIVTIQQLARVAVERQDLSAEDYMRLNSVINIEEVRETYDPYCRDAAGWAMNHSISTSDYMREWIYFGLKYPIQYVLAYKDQTFGYWYPDIQYWVYTDQIRENDLGLYKDSILSDDQRYEMMLFEELYKEIPIYGFLWSIGFVAWIMLSCMGITFIKKDLKAIVLHFPVLGVWGTLLVATPVYAEFRYIYAMFLCLPLSILIPFISEKKENESLGVEG